MKKIMALCLSVATVITAAAVPVFAASTTPLTAEKAREIAQKYLPTGSTHVKTENDDGRFELKFYNENRKEKYEIDISKQTKTLVSFESEKFDSSGGSSVKISEAAAKKAVTKEIENTNILSAKIDYDDGYQEYEVQFTTDRLYGEYVVHPETGAVLKRDIRVGTKPSANTAKDFISYEKAAELALKQVPKGIVTDIDLDKKDGSYYYEVELYKDGYEYEIGLDAKTGDLLWRDSERDKEGWADIGSSPSSAPASTSYISMEKARSIALAKAPSGAVIEECKFDMDDGRAIYEGELRDGRWECEFEIDAVTGAILEWDQEYDD